MTRTREEKLAYQREWYQRNKKRHIANVGKRRIKYRVEIVNKVRKIKESSPCTDCGIKYPYYVMQFDHIGNDKEFDVARGVQMRISERRIMDEIEKCELVCANCHAARTYLRWVDSSDGRAAV